MGRVQVAKLVIHGILLHSFMLYPWPIQLLKLLDAIIRDFVWTGNVDAGKLITIPWKKVCSPSIVGGLGICSIQKINDVDMLRLCWIFEIDQGPWASIAHSRFLKVSGQLVTPYAVFYMV